VRGDVVQVNPSSYHILNVPNAIPNLIMLFYLALHLLQFAWGNQDTSSALSVINGQFSISGIPEWTRRPIIVKKESGQVKPFPLLPQGMHVLSTAIPVSVIAEETFQDKYHT